MLYNYRKPTLIWVLIAINIVLFIATTISPQIMVQLGLIPLFLKAHPWTAVTSMFLHANLWHLLFNMMTLYFFGTFLLMLMDTKRFLLVYFIGGIIGSLFFAWLAPPLSLAVGASGAIYALGGTLVVMRPKVRVLFYFFPMPLWLAILIGFLLTLFPGNGIAWQAHLGGLVVGLIAGYFFWRREQGRVRPGYYSWR
jgi:membrane associated rhomboid family serine protease